MDALKEKEALVQSLQAQLKEKEAYIAQLQQAITAAGGQVPSTAATAATAKLSKNQKKKLKKQQAEVVKAAPEVVPLKEQPAPAKEEVPTVAPATTPESAKNKRKRGAAQSTDAARSPATAAKTAPATPTKAAAEKQTPKKLQETPKESPKKKEATPKKQETPKKAEAEKKETPKEAPKKPASSVQVLKGGLKVEDTLVGTGKVATSGRQVSVLYKGYLTNGKSFDSSLKKPFSFRLGVGEVIKGWDVGVAGMKVGGKRKLVIPPAMGYGRQSMPGIPGNSTLLFEVQLVGVQ